MKIPKILLVIILAFVGPIKLMKIYNEEDNTWKTKVPSAIGNIIENMHKTIKREIKINILMPEYSDQKIDYTIDYILNVMKCDYCIFRVMHKAISLSFLEKETLALIFFNGKDVSIIIIMSFELIFSYKVFLFCIFHRQGQFPLLQQLEEPYQLMIIRN